MKVITLSENFEITEVKEQGKKLKIAFTKEGIEPNDYIFLTNYLNLTGRKYQVIDIHYLKGLFYADLVMIPELEVSSGV